MKRTARVARTRGKLKIIRADGTVERVANTTATRLARETAQTNAEVKGKDRRDT